MDKVLIFGARGYLGGAFREVYPSAICPEVDIADTRVVAEVLEQEKPSIVINTAGKTGRPNIDWCETHKSETLRSNLTGPLVLFEECGKRGIYWVHLSSGCIYEGTGYAACHGERSRATHAMSPFDYLAYRQAGAQGDTATGNGFTEDDPPNFFGSFYSRVKGWCDQILREFPILILRLRMPFDSSLNERNLLMKLRKYPRVLDVQNSLTYLPDFLSAATVLITRRRTGIFNIVNPGTVSPYEIMVMEKNMRCHPAVRGPEGLSSRCRVDAEAGPEREGPADTAGRLEGPTPPERLTLEDLSSVVRAARSNCVLSTAKLQKEGITLPDVHVRVEEALRAMVHL